MPHKPFTLFKRPTTDGKNIYYVRFRDEEGNRLPGRSSGQFSKAAAETWAFEQLNKGLISPQKNITFSQYAKDWWIYDRCPYIQGKIARGFKPSKTYADDMRSLLMNHIISRFKNVKIQRINARMLEKWVLELREKEGKFGGKLSHSTINRILACMKIMMKEAVRLEYLQKNPADPILPLKEDPRRKSIFSLEEVRALFGKDAFEKVWGSNLKLYTINLLGATTGARISEARGLQIKYVYLDYVDIQWAYGKHGLTRPKRSSMRQVPIPEKTSTALQKLIQESPFQEPDSFVFYGDNKDTPIDSKVILDSLYEALNKIGITPAERKSKNLCFHSWRHWYNSMMRSRGIPDAKLRRLTGHRTQEMTEHYTSFSVADYQDVKQIQERLFE
ncbi:MAG: tyrosine-type recombinase/integrase [Spirochaetes bacterium]|nr:tyrosine-type recombinase/integrase [Spirochaetota bacterium]